ncbi:acylphosphatase [Alkalispirochaeta americana]|uniref:Acylphosphatase n=1 Tax=Alkalispirochaeta americana TaxID=159291 RepID=A0A1N6N486_9SPIO|nr:acylphosphatase [Alkalispirochaeta americana]SIP86878.1 acylphosphatase [Alkalispirochaeta americana]
MNGDATTHEAFEAVVRGRVQGVGFRYSTRRVALRQGLVGWVMNNSDGSVQVYAEGPPEALQKLESFLREGPPAGVVTACSIVSRPLPAGRFTTFSIRHG